MYAEFRYSLTGASGRTVSDAESQQNPKARRLIRVNRDNEIRRRTTAAKDSSFMGYHVFGN